MILRQSARHLVMREIEKYCLTSHVLQVQHAVNTQCACYVTILGFTSNSLQITT